jgi:hypothetical protein
MWRTRARVSTSVRPGRLCWRRYSGSDCVARQLLTRRLTSRTIKPVAQGRAASPSAGLTPTLPMWVWSWSQFAVYEGSVRISDSQYAGVKNYFCQSQLRAHRRQSSKIGRQPRQGAGGKYCVQSPLPENSCYIRSNVLTPFFHPRYFIQAKFCQTVWPGKAHLFCNCSAALKLEGFC